MKEKEILTITTQGDINSQKNIDLLNLTYNHLGINPKNVSLKEVPLPERKINWKLTNEDILFVFGIFVILGGITGLILGLIIKNLFFYLTIGILAGLGLSFVFILGKFYYKENGTLHLGRKNPIEEHKFIIQKKKKNN